MAVASSGVSLILVAGGALLLFGGLAVLLFLVLGGSRSDGAASGLDRAVRIVMLVAAPILLLSCLGLGAAGVLMLWTVQPQTVAPVAVPGPVATATATTPTGDTLGTVSVEDSREVLATLRDRLAERPPWTWEGDAPDDLFDVPGTRVLMWSVIWQVGRGGTSARTNVPDSSWNVDVAWGGDGPTVEAGTLTLPSDGGTETLEALSVQDTFEVDGRRTTLQLWHVPDPDTAGAGEGDGSDAGAGDDAEPDAGEDEDEGTQPGAGGD